MASIGYNDLNIAYSEGYPSTIKACNTALSNYFKRYLLQRAINVFTFKNIPDTWDIDYFRYCLFGYGYVAIINTDKFGVIPQHCTLSGYNVFYRPRRVVVSNPLIAKTLDPLIGVQCALIKLQPDYGSIIDTVQYYADMLSTISETLAINVYNSKLSYVFGADGKATAETFKKLYDKISSGEPAAVVSKELFDDMGKPKWSMFQQNVGQNYIGDRLLNDMRSIINMFDTEIGIPNANTTKRERLITDEVNANNIETYTLSDLWLKTIREGLQTANKLYGLSITVDYTFNKIGGATNASDTNSMGIVSMG